LVATIKTHCLAHNEDPGKYSGLVKQVEDRTAQLLKHIEDERHRRPV